MSDLTPMPMRYERRGDALFTPTGGVLYRPRQLPQDRWLVSAEDGIHHRVYKRNGWLRQLLTRRRWRVVSGDSLFQDASAAWSWVEQHCVNRMGPDDWHGVGYARWMQDQTRPQPADYSVNRIPYSAFFNQYTFEPWWVYAFYRDGPPNWDVPEV